MSEDGSDESPSRPKRKIKKVMVLSSDSSSDSDEGVATAGTRRKRQRVLSDDGSDSSGSSVVCAGTRRKRTLPKLRDSGDSDTSGWATDHSDAPKPNTSTAKPNSGFASDSSEGNSDKCSICLLRFTNQEVGTPQSCEHIFCLDCITEWSKNVNTCPVDRMTFDFIVVRTCAGGRVLRNEPVKVVERRPSVEMLVIEDPTVCEVCGGSDREETMLLCDGCDLGYHMACLTPPLTEVPMNQWLCPNCDDLLSDVDTLFSGITDMDMPLEANLRDMPRHVPIRTRSSQLSHNNDISEEPSTSSGWRENRISSDNTPTTSRGSRTSQGTRTRSVTTRRKPTTRRRTHKRRRTKTVIIEYEVQENGKFPVTKRVKRKIKKRKTKRRQPRTAARRSHVRASVRAKLASSGLAAAGAGGARAGGGGGGGGGGALAWLGGIPALSLYGDAHRLDYFSGDDEPLSESASTAATAVAARPTSAVLSAYRQARRKMISVPSPPPAASAPDVLSSILESQTLLHSKKSVFSISVDGSVNIKVESRESKKSRDGDSARKKDRLDLSKGSDAARTVPSYPGQSRGGGGWGGGYRGSYPRQGDQGGGNLGGRGGGYDGGFQNRQGNSFHQQNNSMRRDDGDNYNNYARRPIHPYTPADDQNFDRNRRPVDQNRGAGAGNQRHGEPPQGRYSLAPGWQPYVPPAPAPREPPPQHRHSFGGFENPLDMRVGQVARQNSAREADSNSSQISKPYRPLPEPPVFKFDNTPEPEKSEDEKSDPGLVIDTEKYDPTEPTNDDDSPDEETVAEPLAPAPAPPPPPTPPPPPPPAPEQHTVQNILAGLDTSGMNVPPNVLDSAVRAVLEEHRNLLVPAPAPRRDHSDDDSEGDCPNFSIYSATSVHIANNAEDPPPESEAFAPDMQDDLEDLVQEDDEALPDEQFPPPALCAAYLSPPHSYPIETTSSKKKTEEELKEKVSKRCPITTNPRNPIKIKLNTPSLIKRQMNLYDEEDEEAEEDADPADGPPADDCDHGPGRHDDTPPDVTARKDAVPCEQVEQARLSHGDGKETDDVTETEKGNASPEVDETPSTPAPGGTSETHERTDHSGDEDDDEDRSRRAVSPTDNDGSGDDTDSEDDLSGTEDNDGPLGGRSPADGRTERNDDQPEKMTESISETEDERSYTPCLDENKSKDTSLEVEKDKGIEGLDTEMISEDEGNEMFSDAERASPERASPEPDRASPRRVPPADGEEGEIVDGKRDAHAPAPDTKKKKKKDSKKEAKEKGKGKSKKEGVAFKKLSKSGKERNYRERDKDKEKNKRERRDSSDGGERERNKRRKERRKDLERYDVRTLVSEKRRRPKDAFGRDVSPRNTSATRESPRRSLSPRPRLSQSPRPRRSHSPRVRRSLSPRVRRSPSPRLRRSPSPRLRRSPSPRPRRLSSPRGTPPRLRRPTSTSPRRVRAASSPRRARVTPSPRTISPRAPSPVRAPRRRRRSVDKRRRSPERARKRRRPASGSRSPRPKLGKRKKPKRTSRSGSRRRSPRRRSPRRRRVRRASRTPSPPAAGAGAGAGAADERGSVDSRLLSPRTPPPEPSPAPSPSPRARRRRDPERARHRRARDAPGPSKEVFTSGDNILVSVSFKDQERASGDERRERRRERRRRRRRAAATADPDAAAAKPVAIIDLERSPFRELTPSPRNVIVLLSDDEAPRAPDAGPEAAGEAPAGPKTPPAAGAAPPAPAGEEARGPLTPPGAPRSPDAYDPYEPTRSASASRSASPASAASPRATSPPRALMTLEAAQKTNLSADDVIDRRPLSPIEKVMALLQSTRDVPPDDPPQGDVAAAQPPSDAPGPGPGPPVAGAAGAVALAVLGAALVPPAPAALTALGAGGVPVRMVLPSPTRGPPPKLFLAKPSPIKSDPIKPMPAAKLARPAPAPALGLPAPRHEADGDSPYSPGSSDFGDLFSPPGGGGGGGGGGDTFDALLERPHARARPKRAGAHARVPVKFNRKKGRTQVGVKIDEENLKILDDLPSSAVEMQVKSKFLKKLNRQERVVEEVKLVLKPHYNKKHVTKDEYKDILRRTVPKICHNKTGEINPAKIQALVEAYVKKFRKRHKLGLL